MDFTSPTAGDGNMFSFNILPSPSIAGTSARIGRLIVSKGYVLDTPTFISQSSRGVVPHLSHDTLRNHTNIKGVYTALEDCSSSPTRPHYQSPKPNRNSRGKEPRKATNIYHPHHPPPIHLSPFNSVHHSCSPACTSHQLSRREYR